MRSLAKNCDRSHKCLTAITAELQQVNFLATVSTNNRAA